MNSIPTPIKYNKTLHFNDMVTKPLDLKRESGFIRKVLSDLEKDHAEAYIVKNARGQVIVCRKGLVPAKTDHMERYSQYFALKNKAGNIIPNGKNLRRPESMIGVLRGLLRRSQIRLTELKNSTAHSSAERCRLFGYELVKQNTPFD